VLAYLSLLSPEGTPALRQGLFVRGSLATSRASVLAIPVSAVRTDKPAPYVQAIEDGKIVHKPVTLGQRGSAGAEPVVGVTGVAENTLVVRGNIGFLREGTGVRFTVMEGPATGIAGNSAAAAPGSSASPSKPAP
jgi:membrane fusion protein, multidrug efflux system